MSSEETKKAVGTMVTNDDRVHRAIELLADFIVDENLSIASTFTNPELVREYGTSNSTIGMYLNNIKWGLAEAVRELQRTKVDMRGERVEPLQPGDLTVEEAAEITTEMWNNFDFENFDRRKNPNRKND